MISPAERCTNESRDYVCRQTRVHGNARHQGNKNVGRENNPIQFTRASPCRTLICMILPSG